eukprot:TRINITY_DN22282_c0_g1_i1.p1 TRINITY_DN22282_c0_g1~~TRINITY_DN22282_c0_g1_i1.p1  ORF type:complete len:756 (-),score=152.48 TRINITY_DN22282_c0_g1_i1:445-2490(-)
MEAQLEDAGANDESIVTICAAVASAAFGAAHGAVNAVVSSPSADVGGQSDKNETDGAGEVLCNIPELILMYGGSSKALLSHTSFKMQRGHRYGIVGQNGAGKTTLMAAMLSGAMKELPSSLNLVHVHGGSVMEAKDLEITALAYAKQTRMEFGAQLMANAPTVAEALETVGFVAEMQEKCLNELSGGWQMRLALACAMMRRTDVLLLDEPTNHLDTAAVAWLSSYLKGLTGTSLIISHEPEFLDAVCTDIIHFDQQKLKYYQGNFSNFLKESSLTGDDAKAVLETKSRPSMAAAGKAIQGAQGEIRLVFPIPGKLDGVASQTKPILEMKNASFAYNDDSPFILKGVSVKLSLGSRVAVIGVNGAGKSTLLSLLCGELSPVEFEGKIGEVTRHRNLRLSYIAQRHTFHLEEFLKCTPVHYFQLRFRNGYDEMLQKRLMDPGSQEEQTVRAEMAKKLGKYGNAVRDIVGRQKRGKEIVYEVAWENLDDPKQNTFESVGKLRTMKVDGLTRAYDERLASQSAGTTERPLTEREIVKHLENFEMTDDMCTRRMISGFSAGQKARLMLGAAFWTKPHVVALDEPTNYLDPETVNCLARALKNFRGGVITVTHSQHFIDEVCTDAWHVKSGEVMFSKVEAAATRSDVGDEAPSPAVAASVAGANAKAEGESAKPVKLSAAAKAAKKR